jgi:hypothetical protein
LHLVLRHLLGLVGEFLLAAAGREQRRHQPAGAEGDEPGREGVVDAASWTVPAAVDAASCTEEAALDAASDTVEAAADAVPETRSAACDAADYTPPPLE